jgi:hypothetical protein
VFTRDSLTFVKGGAFKTSRDAGSTKITASTAVGPQSSMSLTAFASSQYNYWMSGLLPATPDLPDSTTLAYFYRDIYLYDNVGGSTVDIMSVFPFSDWELRGLSEKDLEPYEGAIERLNIRELLPQISTSYLTDGYYCGSLVYDANSKNFMDILTHDALQCNISPSPFNNIDPSIRVTVSGPTTEFMNSTSEYAKKYMATMPQGFIEMLREGSFVLDPLTTMFVGRRALTDRAYQSYLHRLLPMYLIEKTMYRGTLTEANRRQRAMTHVTAGDDLWTPTGEELRIIGQLFQDAERDPLGGWITTRNAVQAQDLRPGGDFWKWTDMSDVMTPYKLRALGISEALLSGDSSYAAAESAYSTFLETCDAYRTHITQSTFYKRIFPLIAVANGKFKDPAKAKGAKDIVNFLFNSTNHNNLLMPTVHWHKDLSGKTEDNMMETLEKLDEKSIPIPIKMWLAAAGIDKDTLVRDAKENDLLKKALGVSSNGGTNDQEMSDEFDDGTGFGDDGDSGAGRPEASTLPTRSINSEFARGFRGTILDREWGVKIDAVSGKTEKPKYVHNARAKAVDANYRIAKIAEAAAKDPNYRASLAKANVKRGAQKLKGIV